MNISLPGYITEAAKSITESVEKGLGNLSSGAKGVTASVTDGINSSAGLINKFNKEICPSCQKGKLTV